MKISIFQPQKIKNEARSLGVGTIFNSLIISILLGIVLLPSSVTAASAGEVVITEFMADPTLVSDSNGEWIEIENKTSHSVDITNWDISGSTIVGDIILSPYAKAVICRNIDQSQNGEVICDGRSGFSLSQTGDTERTISLRDETNATVDIITYRGSEDIVAGHSNYVTDDGLERELVYQYNEKDYGTPAHNETFSSEPAQIRVHNTTDLNKNGHMDHNGETGIHNAGWQIRLYDENWNPALYGDDGTNEIVTTGVPFQGSATFHVPPAQYFVCQVRKAGMEQSFVASITSWTTWDDNSVQNNSGNSDEDAACISVGGLSEGRVSTHKFGNADGPIVPTGKILVTKVYDVDADGEPDWNEEEGHQAGWQIRLYDKDWNQTATAVTTDQPFFPANFTVTPGQYHVCEVLQAGYTQSFARTITSWETWPESGSANQSGQSDEGEQCIAVDVQSNSTTSHLFGAVPEPIVLTQ